MRKQQCLIIRSCFSVMLILFFSYFSNLHAQNICFSFDKNVIDTSRSTVSDVIIPIKINFANGDTIKLNRYKSRVTVLDNATTLNNAAYTIEYPEQQIDTVKKFSFAYLILKKDSIEDRARTIRLFIQVIDSGKVVKKNNLCVKDTLTINISEIKNVGVKTYEALTYLGSNFDLASQSVFKDLFFALNVLKTPKQNKSRSGIFFSIYGNTTMADIDTNSTTLHQTRRVKLSDSSYRIFSAQSDILAKTQAQNVGTQVIYLFRAKKKYDGNLQLLLSWSNEFIWRRNTFTSEYRNTRNIDSTTRSGFIEGSYDNILSNTIKYNQFFWNTGPGLFVIYETDKISMRIWANTGYQGTYFSEGSRSLKPNIKNDFIWFFSGKAYVTEPKTGITLQVDVQNTAKFNSPYFGATISKAFDLSKLSGFFSPLNKAAE